MGWLRRRARTTLSFENATSAALEIMIEIIPHRYVLRPGDRMEIDAETQGVPFSLAAYDGGMQIYAGNDVEPKVLINGKPVEPDWDTPLEAP